MVLSPRQVPPESALAWLGEAFALFRRQTPWVAAVTFAWIVLLAGRPDSVPDRSTLVVLGLPLLCLLSVVGAHRADLARWPSGRWLAALFGGGVPLSALLPLGAGILIPLAPALVVLAVGWRGCSAPRHVVLAAVAALGLAGLLAAWAMLSKVGPLLSLGGHGLPAHTTLLGAVTRVLLPAYAMLAAPLMWFGVPLMALGGLSLPRAVREGVRGFVLNRTPCVGAIAIATLLLLLGFGSIVLLPISLSLVGALSFVSFRDVWWHRAENAPMAKKTAPSALAPARRVAPRA